MIINGYEIKSGANLSRADLFRANLYGANLSGADLSYANLYGANLSYANLSYANLSYANLSYANLYGANLSGADLSRADLSGANLYGADAIIQFGPIGKERRIGYAVIGDDTVNVKLGCFYDTLDRALAAIRDKYGDGSTYEQLVSAACDELRERNRNDA